MIISAQATTFVEVPFPSAVKDSPVIARGKIGMSYTEWARTSDGSKRIYTFTELQVDELLKGKTQNPRSITMRELGGEKDGVGMQVAGTAQFERGEEVVVFLSEPNSDGSHFVQGMMMGKFMLEKGDDGKEYLVGPGIGSGTHPSLRGHEHVLPGGQEQDDTPPGKKWSLADLRELIRNQAQGEESPQNAEKSPPKPRVTQAVKPLSPTPEASGNTAPQLQSSSPEDASQEANPLSHKGLWVGLIAAVGAVLWGLRVKRPR